MPLQARRGAMPPPVAASAVELQCLNVGMFVRSYVFSLVIWYAKSILVIPIQILAKEADSEAAEVA